MSAAPVLVEVYAPVDRDIKATATQLVGRPVTAMHAHRLLRRDLELVVARWRVYGAWVERVESGLWYASWSMHRHAVTGCAKNNPSDDVRDKRSASMRAAWARRKATALRKDAHA